MNLTHWQPMLIVVFQNSRRILSIVSIFPGQISANTNKKMKNEIIVDEIERRIVAK